jgi:hypothetical protein
MDGSKSGSRATVTEILSHISTKPWSDYTAADYTLEQWHAACLIHQHVGPPTTKGECKLPVRTPNGAINQNGVYAAAAALAGARGGVNATLDEKAKAAKALVQMYKDMKKEPPPSLLSLSVSQVLAHHGVLGMHWGVRKSTEGHRSGDTGKDRGKKSTTPTPVTIGTKRMGRPGIKTSGGKGHPATADATRHAIAKQTAKKSSTDSLSDKELKDLVNRMNMEQSYDRMRSDPGGIGKRFVGKLLGNVGNQQASNYANAKVSSAIAASGAKKAARAAQVAAGLAMI